MKLLKITLIFAAIAVFAFACAESPNTGNGSNANTANFTANSPKNTLADASPAPTVSEVASGGKLYNQYCAKCHKEDGTGGEVVIEGQKLKPEDLTSAHAKKEPDAEYIEYITKGIPSEGMPSFKDELSEAQMKEIVKYIREEIQK